MPPPFLQPSCALRSRFEAVPKGLEKAKLCAGNQRQGRRHHGASSGIGEATAVTLAERGAGFSCELVPLLMPTAAVLVRARKSWRGAL
jgi:hypothetical protein